MLIVCPSCATSYDVDPASLQPHGRQVRCVRCRTVWHAEVKQAERLVAAAVALAPDPPIPQEALADEVAAEAANTEWIVQAAEAEPLAGPLPEPPEEEVTSAEPWTIDPLSEPIGALAEDAPPIAPVDLDAGRPPIEIEPDPDPDAFDAGAHHYDIETLAAARRPRRPAKPRPKGWPMSPLQSAVLALVIVDAMLIGWRKDVVRALPQTASFYALMGLSVNLRGLEFTQVATTTESHEGVPILVVTGNIVNESAAAVGLPRLKLVVRNAAKEDVYSWTAAPPRASLLPGQAVAFRTRLASPPLESHDVLVRFLTRSDIVAEPR